MYGVFKRLRANDIKITPFEANKQYLSSDIASIGALTASIEWSPNNKSTFTSGNLKYHQLDKLYYRDYINNRANLIELEDAPYKKQERRLYESASIVSLSQKTFGNGVKPYSFEYSSSLGHFIDDGYGNLYNSSKGLTNWPDEDNRVVYLGPVRGFEYYDLSINPEDGNPLVNYSPEYTSIEEDDSYQKNPTKYLSCSFYKYDEYPFISSSTNGYIEVENRPYLNYNSEDFSISFFYKLKDEDSTEGTKTLVYKKEAYYTPNSNTTQLTVNGFEVSLAPEGPQYPYKIYYTFTSDTGSIYFERTDGNVLSIISASLFYDGDTDLKHIICNKSGSTLNIYIDGTNQAVGVDNTSGHCSNNSNLRIYPNSGISQFMIWDRSFDDNVLTNISESYTGTYPIGNIFYDNGFGVITHPKYKSIFDDIEYLKYKGSTFITENEYQCTVGEDEFNSTSNITIRTIPSIYGETIQNFATGSYFKPYITTIGLYDDDANLLAVGKLGQPVKTSTETDTTFILRFDL